MKWYKASLQMQSWTASDWQADTIFGHLCWGMRYLYGDSELASFLESYRASAPPLLLSNGFPDDLLPKPLLPPTRMEQMVTLAQQREEFRQIKKLKRVTYITLPEFTALVKGEHPKHAIKEQDSNRDSIGMRRVTLKNQINRETGTTGGEGQLFNIEEFRWASVSIYLKLEESFLDRVRSLFDYIHNVGYGKRKSVGYGQTKSFSLTAFDGFPSPSVANGFVSLSNFVPAPRDPTSGCWSLIVKYGKLGEEFAIGDNPFKRPLVMLEAGSTFYDAPCHECYGRLVEKVSPANPQVVQYGFALPVPMKMPEWKG